MAVRLPAALTSSGTVSPHAGPEGGPSQRSSWLNLVDRIGDFWILGVLGLMILAFGLLSPGHDLFSRASWLNTSQFAVEFLILAVGQTFVIITGGIDLSDGAVLGFTGMVSGAVMQSMLSQGAGGLLTTVTGFAVALVLGGAIGFVNGYLITRLKLPPFIVTLGSLTAIGAGPSLINGGNEVSNLPNQISTIGSTEIGSWVYVTVLIAAGVFIVMGFVLHRTRFGLRTYAVGSNNLGARRAGINVDRHLVMVYTISGVLAGLAGMMVMANLDVATPLAGQNDELNAIAAVVIGGASLFGGRGHMLGTVVGTFIIALLVTGLVLVGVSGSWQQVATGIIIVFAVAIDQVRLRLAER
ncbi:MAG TPA: ABC transporter permease [Acidimicrobiales bacterium]|nr:ABC transporter permease [Acidimicrobiales bacterium]